MRFRRALVVSLLLALGCQDKKPDTFPPADDGMNTLVAPATTTALTGAAPAQPPLEGTIEGKPFRPGDVTLEALRDVALLTFRQTVEKQETTIQVQLPVRETEKVGGREWKAGGNVDDPVVTIGQPGKDKADVVFGPDYTMTLKFRAQSRDAVEGEIDFTATKPAGTRLKGAFRAAYRSSPTGPIGPDDAPCVYGKIILKTPKKTEKLAAGFVGIGTDGQPYSNEPLMPVDIGQPVHTPSPNAKVPSQLSILASTNDAVLYRHLNMPPGDYLVYVRRDTIMSAWKRVQVKAGELRELDLTIDPAMTGEVVVTLPAAGDSAATSLDLVPLGADLQNLGLGSNQYFSVATVKMGETKVTVQSIPAGKYRAVRGTDEAEVDVVAGKSVAVTLGPRR
jgi:hypothetical protein